MHTLVPLIYSIIYVQLTNETGSYHLISCDLVRFILLKKFHCEANVKLRVQVIDTPLLINKLIKNFFCQSEHASDQKEVKDTCEQQTMQLTCVCITAQSTLGRIKQARNGSTFYILSWGFLLSYNHCHCFFYTHFPCLGTWQIHMVVTFLSHMCNADLMMSIITRFIHTITSLGFVFIWFQYYMWLFVELLFL